MESRPSKVPYPSVPNLLFDIKDIAQCDWVLMMAQVRLEGSDPRSTGGKESRPVDSSTAWRINQLSKSMCLLIR